MKPNIKVLCLSGWAQSHQSLNPIFDNLEQNCEIINFDYSKIKNSKTLFNKLKELNQQPDVIIGWSLGGQLAMRCILEKIFHPKLLILLSTPIQFIESEDIKKAMPRIRFEEFKYNFQTSPDKTLKRFLALMLMNDSKAKNNIKSAHKTHIDINQSNHLNLVYWLEELGKFSFNDIQLSDLPKSLLIHGDKDAVVNFNQSSLIKKKINNSKLEIFNDCGHIIHLHDLTKLQSVIKRALNELHI